MRDFWWLIRLKSNKFIEIKTQKNSFCFYEYEQCNGIWLNFIIFVWNTELNVFCAHHNVNNFNKFDKTACFYITFVINGKMKIFVKKIF